MLEVSVCEYGMLIYVPAFSNFSASPIFPVIELAAEVNPVNVPLFPVPEWSIMVLFVQSISAESIFQYPTSPSSMAAWAVLSQIKLVTETN